MEHAETPHHELEAAQEADTNHSVLDDDEELQDLSSGSSPKSATELSTLENTPNKRQEEPQILQEESERSVPIPEIPRKDSATLNDDVQADSSQPEPPPDSPPQRKISERPAIVPSLHEKLSALSRGSSKKSTNPASPVSSTAPRHSPTNNASESTGEEVTPLARPPESTRSSPILAASIPSEPAIPTESPPLLPHREIPPPLLRASTPPSPPTQVLSITIHRTDALRADINVHHPLVRIHLVDRSTGHYIKKAQIDRGAVTTFEFMKVSGEAQPRACDFILPVLTQPFEFRKHRVFTPMWEEEFIYDEAFSHVVRPDLLVLFEVLDFGPSVQTKPGSPVRGWYPIAWAFLVPVGGVSANSNVGRPVRLQLYQYPKRSWLSSQRMAALPAVFQEIPEVYRYYRQSAPPPVGLGKKRSSYPATLYVTLNAKTRPPVTVVKGRPMLPTHTEISANAAFHTLQHSTQPAEEEVPLNENVKHIMRWRRLPGQQCIIPTTVAHRLKSAQRGCFTVKFSHNGLYLATACADMTVFPIKIYETKTGVLVRTVTHHDLVYDLSWAHDDSLLLTSSSDGTAKIWAISTSSPQRTDVTASIGYAPVSSSEVSASVVISSSLPTKVGSHNALVTLHHSSYVYCGQFYPLPVTVDAVDHRVVATGGYFGSKIRFFAVPTENNGATTPTAQTDISGHHSYVTCLLFNADGSLLVSGDLEGVVLLSSCTASPPGSSFPLNIEPVQVIDLFQGSAISSLSLHPSGERRLLVHTRALPTHSSPLEATQSTNRAHSKAGLYSVDLRLFRETHRFIGFENHEWPLKSEFSPDGRYVVSGSEDGRVYVWNANTTGLEHKFADLGFVQPVTSVAWHPHDHYLACCSFGVFQPVVVLEHQEKKKETIAPSKTQSTQPSSLPTKRPPNAELDSGMKQLEDMLSSLLQSAADVVDTQGDPLVSPPAVSGGSAGMKGWAVPRGGSAFARVGGRAIPSPPPTRTLSYSNVNGLSESQSGTRPWTRKTALAPHERRWRQQMEYRRQRRERLVQQLHKQLAESREDMDSKRLDKETATRAGGVRTVQDELAELLQSREQPLLSEPVSPASHPFSPRSDDEPGDEGGHGDGFGKYAAYA